MIIYKHTFTSQENYLWKKIKIHKLVAVQWKLGVKVKGEQAICYKSLIF